MYHGRISVTGKDFVWNNRNSSFAKLSGSLIKALAPYLPVIPDQRAYDLCLEILEGWGLEQSGDLLRYKQEINNGTTLSIEMWVY